MVSKAAESRLDASRNCLAQCVERVTRLNKPSIGHDLVGLWGADLADGVVASRLT